MLEPEWTADIAIDADLATRLIADQFPDLRGVSVEPFGMGWDNAAFLVDGRFVFRFPRRLAFAGSLAREIAILPLLAPHLPCRISTPELCGVASDAFPWAFAGYRLIEGTTACGVALDDDARTALAEPLARVLRALHRVDAAPLVARGLPPDELGRLDHERLTAKFRGRMPSVTTAIGAESARAFLRWFGTHPPRALDLSSEARVVHGDLYARHIVLDAGSHLAGIIDWGDMHLGDPALDLAVAHLMLPRSAHAIFRAAYGEIDERAWEAAHFRAIYHAVLELDYGIRGHDDGMRRIGTDALRMMESEL